MIMQSDYSQNHRQKTTCSIKSGDLRVKLDETYIDSSYLIGYTRRMITIRETDVFKNWIRGLRNRRARSIINARIRRLSLGNKGDTKQVGDGITELRVDFGSGYRVYYIHEGQQIIILLCGGDKSTQAKDIENAKQIAQNLEVL